MLKNERAGMIRGWITCGKVRLFEADWIETIQTTPRTTSIIERSRSVRTIIGAWLVKREALDQRLSPLRLASRKSKTAIVFGMRF